jgi:hypothetical protein
MKCFFFFFQFRAGKMNLSGTTVTPDKRKGLVMVEQVIKLALL